MMAMGDSIWDIWINPASLYFWVLRFSDINGLHNYPDLSYIRKKSFSDILESKYLVVPLFKPEDYQIGD